MAKRSNKKKKKKKKSSFLKNRKWSLKPEVEEVVKPLQEDILDSGEEQEEVIDEQVSVKLLKKSKKKAKMKPRKGLGEELIEVYEAAGDDLTSVTTLEHRRRSWQRMLIWILGFLVAAFVGVAGVAWWIWGGQQSLNGEQVQFEISQRRK